MVNSMKMKTKSPSCEWTGWDIIEFIKGRKKSAITLVAVGLCYILSDSELASIISGLVVESVLALGEYYFKKIP